MTTGPLNTADCWNDILGTFLGHNMHQGALGLPMLQEQPWTEQVAELHRRVDALARGRVGVTQELLDAIGARVVAMKLTLARPPADSHALEPRRAA